MSDMGLVDIGANLLNGQFRDDLDAVLARARDAGLGHMMVTATDVADSAAAIELCRGHADLSCTVGVHPHAAAKTLKEGGDWVAQLRALANEEPVCAIGEAGLDFYRNFSPPEDQHVVFDTQIRLADDLGLPLFVHDRDSGGAVYDALMNQAGQLNGVVIHCFTGDETDLRRYLAAGFHIGITGWVCDRRRGERLRGLIPQIPLDRLLIETDAPFLLPQGADSPTADKRRNEPCLLPFIARAIADLLDMPTSELARQTAANARRLFHGRGAPSRSPAEGSFSLSEGPTDQ